MLSDLIVECCRPKPHHYVNLLFFVILYLSNYVVFEIYVVSLLYGCTYRGAGTAKIHPLLFYKMIPSLYKIVPSFYKMVPCVL